MKTKGYEYFFRESILISIEKLCKPRLAEYCLVTNLEPLMVKHELVQTTSTEPQLLIKIPDCSFLNPFCFDQKNQQGQKIKIELLKP